MILETIVSTTDAEGRPNFAPMGITIEGETVLLRPYREARTWRNLQQVGEGVVNITDDVLVFAHCAVSSEIPPHHAAGSGRRLVLDDVCSWKEFVVERNDLSEERGRFWGRVVAEGRGRDFAGFNRAKHAVIEATILATRVFLLGRETVLQEFDRLGPLVDKTGGPREKESFGFLLSRVREGRGVD